MKTSFGRSFDELPRIFEASRAFYDAESVGEGDRFAVDFAIEEIFTNMVKYQPGSQSPIEVELRREPDRLVVVLTDRDVDRFDLAEAPVPDIEAPLDKRRPGGLGLLLTRRVMTTFDYEYYDEDRRSRVTMTRELT